MAEHKYTVQEIRDLNERSREHVERINRVIDRVRQQVAATNKHLQQRQLIQKSKKIQSKK